MADSLYDLSPFPVAFPKVQLFSLYKIYDNCMHCHYIFNCFMFVHQMQCFVFIVFSKCIALASLVIAFLWPQGLELI